MTKKEMREEILKNFKKEVKRNCPCPYVGDGHACFADQCYKEFLETAIKITFQE